MIKQLIKTFTVLTTVIWRYNSAYAFDKSDFQGNYALLLEGTSSFVNSNQGSTVATGVIFANGKGSATGHGILRTEGISCNINISGSYSINPDGTGILATVGFTNTPGCFTNVLDFALVLAKNGQMIEIANIENDYLSGTLTRHSTPKFKLSDFSGSYAIRLQGTSSIVRANQARTVGVAIIKADGKGSVSGKATLRSAGVSCTGTITGSNQVAKDGTGAINMIFQTSTPGCFTSVVDLSMALANSNLGVVANTENDMMSGTLKRLVFN